MFNDPLFLRTPKGVVPTARANALAPAIADVLARTRSVLAAAEPFDPAKSKRRFTIGAPDGASAVVLPPLLDALKREAPGIDISLKQLLPKPGETETERAWSFAFADLEAREMDIAILPIEQIPARFMARTLYEEEFIVAARAGHPYTDELTLDRYCAIKHLVVSHSGEAYGFVDRLLGERGRSRRIALTVPNFMFALAVIAGSDLVSALPRRFAQQYGPRFGVAAIEPPLPLGRFKLNVITSRAAMMDAGVAWLLELL
jgi:DNA-binding transcriptional LysR family regulator